MERWIIDTHLPSYLIKFIYSETATKIEDKNLPFFLLYTVFFLNVRFIQIFWPSLTKCFCIYFFFFLFVFFCCCGFWWGGGGGGVEVRCYQIHILKNSMCNMCKNTLMGEKIQSENFDPWSKVSVRSCQEDLSHLIWLLISHFA